MRILYFSFFFLMISIFPVFAYLDPGTGSLVVSAIIGAVATVIFVFKGWFFKLFGILKKSRKAENTEKVDKK